MVLQDDAGPGLEEPASSLQLAQLRLQEQLDARACARLCWLQMEGPYRLCRLVPYTGVFQQEFCRILGAQAAACLLCV